jgi:hypothetical protein
LRFFPVPGFSVGTSGASRMSSTGPTPPGSRIRSSVSARTPCGASAAGSRRNTARSIV